MKRQNINPKFALPIPGMESVKRVFFSAAIFLTIILLKIDQINRLTYFAKVGTTGWCYKTFFGTKLTKIKISPSTLKARVGQSRSLKQCKNILFIKTVFYILHLLEIHFSADLWFRKIQNLFLDYPSKGTNILVLICTSRNKSFANHWICDRSKKIWTKPVVSFAKKIQNRSLNIISNFKI